MRFALGPPCGTRWAKGASWAEGGHQPPPCAPAATSKGASQAQTNLIALRLVIRPAWRAHHLRRLRRNADDGGAVGASDAPRQCGVVQGRAGRQPSPTGWRQGRLLCGCGCFLRLLRCGRHWLSWRGLSRRRARRARQKGQQLGSGGWRRDGHEHCQQQERCHERAVHLDSSVISVSPVRCQRPRRPRPADECPSPQCHVPKPVTTFLIANNSFIGRGR
jgi:hypothetical protein